MMSGTILLNTRGHFELGSISMLKKVGERADKRLKSDDCIPERLSL